MGLGHIDVSVLIDNDQHYVQEPTSCRNISVPALPCLPKLDSVLPYPRDGPRHDMQFRIQGC